LICELDDGGAGTAEVVDGGIEGVIEAGTV
jgi:hypothetical protein